MQFDHNNNYYLSHELQSAVVGYSRMVLRSCIGFHLKAERHLVIPKFQSLYKVEVDNLNLAKGSFIFMIGINRRQGIEPYRIK